MPLSRWVSRFGLVIARVFRATAPDPFVIALLLLLLTCLMALVWGDFGRSGPEGPGSLGQRLWLLADCFRDPGSGPHIWSLLGFAMQMCLVLISGHVLASAPPVRRVIDALADRPRSAPAAAAMVGLVACLAGLINWGLGLIVGALLARDVGRSLARRGIPHHAPLIAAAGYFGLMVWHGGLSGTAPLAVTTAQSAARTLPPDVMARLAESGLPDGIPLDRTLLTGFNLFITAGLVAIVPVGLWLLTPRDPADMTPTGLDPDGGRDPRPAPDAPDDRGDADNDADSDRAGRIPGALERSRLVALILAVVLALGLWRFAAGGSVLRAGLNEIIALMLVLGVLAHATPRRFVAAVDDAAGCCGGIIVQFPIYAAIIAVMVQSGLAGALSSWAAGASASALPLATFFSAAVVNLFIPSGGGQWAVQGPIVLRAALDAGVDPGRALMCVAYGDQITNMLQPFWALPLLAIVRIRAREIVGYSAAIMVAGIAWTVLGLRLFMPG
jgi:short-chain fatty acids transporter